MVNLKRPTLRLSPLAPPEESSGPEASQSQHHHHGLEFEYDCDAPKCGIYVHVLLSPDHPDAGPITASSNGLSKLLVFDTVVDGGFGRVLKLEDGAMLELGHFEKTGSSSTAKASENPNASSTSIPATGGAAAAAAATANQTSEEPFTSNRNTRRRFTRLQFRKRSHNQSVSGPALAVVDAQPSDPTGGKNTNDDPEKEGGVRVIIRLVALDANGTELASPNEQVTYLHIIRFGQKPTGKTAEAPADNNADNAEHNHDEEDTRPWVVKVVKREATVCRNAFPSLTLLMVFLISYFSDRTTHFPSSRNLRSFVIFRISSCADSAITSKRSYLSPNDTRIGISSPSQQPDRRRCHGGIRAIFRMSFVFVISKGGGTFALQAFGCV